MMKLTNKVIDVIKPRILHYNSTHNKFVKKSIDNYMGKNFSNVKRIKNKEKQANSLNIEKKLTQVQKSLHGPQRPVERIDELLELIRIIWNKYPDLRLGQLILNNVNEDKLYNIEDKDLYEILKNKYIGNDRSIKL